MKQPSEKPEIPFLDGMELQPIPEIVPTAPIMFAIRGCYHGVWAIKSGWWSGDAQKTQEQAEILRNRGWRYLSIVVIK